MPDFFNEQKDKSKNPLKPKAPFKWFLMEIIPETTPNVFTSETNFSNHILTVDAYSKIPNIMVCKELLQKKIWTSRICFNLYLE